MVWTGIERGTAEIEDLIDSAGNAESTHRDPRARDPEAVAYFRGVLKTLRWLQGDISTRELLAVPEDN